MPRLSTLSNPTGLVELDKQRVGIMLDESAGRQGFSLMRLDLKELQLPSPLNVVVIARRGNAEERLELGSVSDWDMSYKSVSSVGDDGTWTFRVLLVQPGSPKLVAAAENVRPQGQGDSSSFIALEPATDLGQRPWDIHILDQDGRAVIRFNKDIYASSGEAEADPYFTGLILPEAIRRVAEWVANDPAVLVEAWEPFKAWMALHGITDEPESDTADARAEWTARVVHAFCDRFEFASHLRNVRMKGAEE